MTDLIDQFSKSTGIAMRGDITFRVCPSLVTTAGAEQKNVELI
jgi:hypothetical protein